MALLPHCCIRKIGVAMSVFGRNFSSVKQGSYYLLELGKEPKGLELEDVDRPLERPQSRRRRGAHTLTSKRACQFRNSSGLKACGDRETRRGSVPGEAELIPQALEKVRGPGSFASYLLRHWSPLWCGCWGRGSPGEWYLQSATCRCSGSSR